MMSQDVPLLVARGARSSRRNTITVTRNSRVMMPTLPTFVRACRLQRVPHQLRLQLYT